MSLKKFLPAVIVLATVGTAAVAVPAGAAGVSPAASGYSWGADQVGLNFTQPAAHDISFHFTSPRG